MTTFEKCNLISSRITFKVSRVSRLKNTETATNAFFGTITQDASCPLMLYFPKLKVNDDDIELISMRFWRNSYDKHLSLLCSGSGKDVRLYKYIKIREIFALVIL